MPTVEDSRGRTVTVDSRPQRIVSLVPSLTESVAFLVGATRLAAITKFCTEPQEQVAAIRKIGGTKDPQVEAIVALQPDLVLANREENREEDIAALEAAGLSVFVGYPKGVQESVEELVQVGTLLQASGARRRLSEVTAEVERQEQLNAQRPRVRVFCPIWRQPYMAVGGDTYAGDVIRLVGGENVFESHPRGNRYPQVDLAEIAAVNPDVILLPDEPYRFRDRHREEMLTLRSITAAREDRVFLVDGRWLSWYGPRAAEGLAGLEALLDQARGDWAPPARPSAKPSKAAAQKEAATKKGARGARKASAKKADAKKAGRTSGRPRRKPKTDSAMPPGLKLQVRSREVVDE